MARKRQPKPVTAEITSLSTRGNGVGNVCDDDGDVLRKIEVPFTVPGDVVIAEPMRCRRPKGRLLTFEKKSPQRQQPLCQHFGVCGGCRLQQLPYSSQLQYKQQLVEKLFANLPCSDYVILPILPCHWEWQYRNKMEYTFSSDKEGNQYLGLVMDSTKGKVMNNQECHLVEPWQMDALRAVRQWWSKSGLEAFHLRKATGTLRTLSLRQGISSGDRMVILTVSGDPAYAPSKVVINEFVDALRQAIEPPSDSGSKLSIFMRIQQAMPGMSTNFYEMLLYGPDHIRETLVVPLRSDVTPDRYQFHISPTAFFQPNPRQAALLFAAAFRLFDLKPDSVLYDLYCGTGVISICCAGAVKEVVGIEVSPESSLDARMNVKLNSLNNVSIYTGAVRYVLSQLKEEKKHPQPDVVVIDPPRAGIDSEALNEIINLSAPHLIYISCNIETQVRDIEYLIQNGYKLCKVQPVDHFPQTYHVENIAYLSKQA